jgi:hypothetical protein
LHVITVGTKELEERVQSLADAINQKFQSDHHLVEELGSGNYTVNYKLPEGCYWVEQKNTYENSQQWPIDVRTISNNALEDKDWNAIKSTDNLLLAWARARLHLMKQVLVDEVEIRLFEADLHTNIYNYPQKLDHVLSDIYGRK